MPTIQFSREMRKVGRAVDNGATGLTRRVAKNSLRRVVWSSVVDTGKGRSNFRMGISRPPSGTIEAYHEYPKNSKADGMGSSETANANAAISAGIAVINRLKGSGGAGLKRALYLSNNIDGEHFFNTLGDKIFPEIDRFVQTELRDFNPFKGAR